MESDSDEARRDGVVCWSSSPNNSSLSTLTASSGIGTDSPTTALPVPLKNKSVDSAVSPEHKSDDQPLDSAKDKSENQPSTVITDSVYNDVKIDLRSCLTMPQTFTPTPKNKPVDPSVPPEFKNDDQVLDSPEDRSNLPSSVILSPVYEDVKIDINSCVTVPQMGIATPKNKLIGPSISLEYKSNDQLLNSTGIITNIPRSERKVDSVSTASADENNKYQPSTVITNPVYENVHIDIKSCVTIPQSITATTKNKSIVDSSTIDSSLSSEYKSDNQFEDSAKVDKFKDQTSTLITNSDYENVTIDLKIFVTVPRMVIDTPNNKAVNPSVSPEDKSEDQPLDIAKATTTIPISKGKVDLISTVPTEDEDQPQTVITNLVYDDVKFDINIGAPDPAGTDTPKNESADSVSTLPAEHKKVDNPPIIIRTNPVYDGVKFDIRSDKDSIISSREFDYSDKDKPKIPDGGWGWVVVLSSLVISMIADGISFSFGLLYSEFLVHFGASKSATSWIGSLFMAVPLLSGPIGSALVDRYGCRLMTILGGIISGLGFVMSIFCNSVFTMYLTFGVVAGMGLGLCYVTAVVSIAYWFDKKRTLATSLGACGTGIGTFVYAPMTQYFINEYGWRGTVLLLAGTFFNMCVCGSVMRDPAWWIKEQNKSPSLGNKSIRGSSCGSISGRSTENDFPGIEEIRKLLKSGEAPEYILTALATSMKKELADVPEDLEQKEMLSNFHSVVNLPTFIRQNEKVPMEVLESLSNNRKMFNVILENYPSLLLCRSLSDQELRTTDATTTRMPLTMSMRLKPTKKVTSPTMVPEGKGQVCTVKSDHGKVCLPWMETVPMLRRQFSLKENTHYLKDIKIHRNSVMYRGAMLNIHKYRLRASSCPDIYRNSMTTIARETEETWQSVIKDLFKGMCDFSLFLELHFMLMSVATILLFVWFIVPYFYLAEHVTHHNMTQEDASIIISVIGMTNTIGMVFLGWAGDQPWMNVTKTYSVCLIACGLSTIGMPLCSDNYWALLAVSASFGIFFASNFSFTPTILVELVPLERFTTAYGLCLLCQGIGNLVGPPIAGFVFDVTQSWDLSFYLAGFWIVISGFLVALIPATNNRKIWGSGPTEKDRDSVCA